MVVYRPNTKTSWNDRCRIDSPEYDENKSYNHRSILKTEIVIEFDEYFRATNRKYADIVAERFKKDNIQYSKWSSGNKSTHLHTILDIGKVKNLPLLKKVFMRHYTQNLPLPDLRLAVTNHLIRAEYGIHEKTRKHKTLISKTKDYPTVSGLPKVVWDKYIVAERTVVKRRLTMDVKSLELNPKVQLILNSDKFGKYDDGRERALFMLIHILKPKYLKDKPGLVKYLQEWYHYSGGRQLTDHQVKRKIDYHWDKTYNFGNTYLNELLESIGVKTNDF